MTIDDIKVMPIADRARALVGDMPWVTENLSPGKIADLVDHIAVVMTAAVLQEREACAEIAAARSTHWGNEKEIARAIRRRLIP